MAVQRIEILGVPVDIVQPQELEEVINSLNEETGVKQIVFLSIWDLLKARRKNEFAKTVRNANLIIPISKSIISGARFLKKSVPVRYNPFNFTINLLSILENGYKSFYLLGGRKKTLSAAEKHVRMTFPNLKMVGRYVGYYPKTVESDIIQAIYKASPTLVLLSEGVKEKDCWLNNKRDSFTTSTFLYYRDLLGILSERNNRINEKTFEKGLEIVPEIIKNPLKLFLIFPFLWYNILLVCKRLFNK